MNLDFWKVGELVSLREAFGRVLVCAARDREDFVLFDADVAGGTGAKPLIESFPERVMQFGIAEQNMMAAAGTFSELGVIPVVSTFSAFGVMRAHEQFRTAIAYPNRNVKVCCSHVGVDVGPDGATAQMLEDLATMRAIPNTAVVVPADANEFMRAFLAVLDWEGPVYMRIGRSPAPVITVDQGAFRIGRATCLREGEDLTIVATGVMVARAMVAAETLEKQGCSARVLNLSTIKPLETEALSAAALETGAVITAEDHNVIGGMGSAVAEYLVEHCPVPMRRVGVMDRFGRSGEPEELAEAFGLTADRIVKEALLLMEQKNESCVS